MRRLGITLRRKLLPAEEYFANIAEHMQGFPTSEQMRKWKDGKVPLKWKRKYARLVNAFGWNGGRMSRFIPSVHADTLQAGDQEQGLDEAWEDLGDAGEHATLSWVYISKTHLQ